MTTVADLKARILYELSDTDQYNYTNAEIWYQFNRALRFIGHELSQIDSSIGVKAGTLVISKDDTSVSLPSDFSGFAMNEYGQPRIFNATNGYARMEPATASEVDAWEGEPASFTGAPSKYYFQGQTLYVHPRAGVETTIKYYYYPLETISNDSSTVPWGGLFDDAIVQFVVMALRMRDERLNMTQLDTFLFDTLKRGVVDILFRRDGFALGFASGSGWN